MAKKEEIQGVQCENADFEIIRRQLARLEKMLTDKFSEVNDRIESITVQAPAFPPPAEPQHPQPIEVSLSDNIASREDIRALSGVIQTLNGTVSLVMKSLAEIQKAFAAMPRPDVEAVATDAAMKAAQATANKVIIDLTPKIDNSADKAVRLGAVNAAGISFDDAASIHQTLKETNRRICVRDNVDKLSKRNLKLELCVFIFSFVVLGLGCWIYNLSKERDELLEVEWLYRGIRSLWDDDETITSMEKIVLSGTDKQREDWQTETVNREQSGIPFRYFQPHDDWQPEPPKVKEEQKNDDDSGGWFDWLYTPTENEKAAQEAVRNNPNIPEGAKP